MGYLIDLMISLFFPLNIEKKKKGNADNADVEDSGSPIYIPTMKDNKHSKVDKIIVFLIPNTTVNVLLSIDSSPFLSGIFANKMIEE